MLGFLGMVLLVLGGLMTLSALRSYALFRVNKDRPAKRMIRDGWQRMLVGMLIAGAVLIGTGYLLAF
jgi:hypothetical protein